MPQRYKRRALALFLITSLTIAPVLAGQRQGHDMTTMGKMNDRQVGKGKKQGKMSGMAAKKTSHPAGNTSNHTNHSGHKPGMNHTKMTPGMSNMSGKMQSSPSKKTGMRRSGAAMPGGMGHEHR